MRTGHNDLIGMQKKTRALVGERQGKVPFEPFLSLVVNEEGIDAKGSYVEAQVRYSLCYVWTFYWDCSPDLLFLYCFLIFLFLS